MAIDRKFWSGARWDSHAAFSTIGHVHISCYSPAPGCTSCDIMAVECKDGRWYIEDSGNEAKDAEGVWNPFDPSDAEPLFFGSEDAAVRRAVAVVASVSGVAEDTLLQDYLED